MPNKFFNVRMMGVIMSTALLAACAPFSMNLFNSQSKGLEELTQHMGGDVGTLAFTFDLDDKAGGSADEVGSGYIVVFREGKEIQALPHAFEMPPERLPSNAWLQFKDFNGDGLMDFKASRLEARGGQLSLDSLYQFDPKSGTFALVDALSSVGEIEVSSPGCVSLKLLTAARTSKIENLCYVVASGQWALAKGHMGRRQIEARPAVAECDPLSPNLSACRTARIEMDRKLLSLLGEYRIGKRKALQSVQGKGYADTYAKQLDWDHLSWKRYRDSRCSVEVRERAVSIKAMPAAVELCRYDWARDQVRRYNEQSARLLNENPKQ